MTTGPNRGQRELWRAWTRLWWRWLELPRTAWMISSRATLGRWIRAAAQVQGGRHKPQRGIWAFWDNVDQKIRLLVEKLPTVDFFHVPSVKLCFLKCRILLIIAFNEHFLMLCIHPQQSKRSRGRACLHVFWPGDIITGSVAQNRFTSIFISSFRLTHAPSWLC